MSPPEATVALCSKHAVRFEASRGFKNWLALRKMPEVFPQVAKTVQVQGCLSVAPLITWPLGRNGRRSGFKIRRSKEREGSSPSEATANEDVTETEDVSRATEPELSACDEALRAIVVRSHSSSQITRQFRL